MMSSSSSYIRYWLLLTLLSLGIGLTAVLSGGNETILITEERGGCTSIMVGRLATVDGSVITSHTCDGLFRTWVDISAHSKNEPDARNKIYTGLMGTKYSGDEDRLQVTGEITDVPESYLFINTSYPAMNEHQLGIGETTFVGKPDLMNLDGGLFKIEEIERLMLERCRTAREAIRLADELTKEYGYIDYGECLTICDPKEVWHFEIMGATPKYIGAVWAAVRIPDDHVGVSANASRIGELDLSNPDFYMASENIYSLAEEMGWWDPNSGEPFKFYRVYGGQQKNYWTHREWRVLGLAAPSLNLDPEMDELPFSVKAERKISVRDVMEWFRDTYEDTPFDWTKDLYVKNRKGDVVKSPIASPWISLDMRDLLNALKPETVPFQYTIANNMCSYSTVIQARDWLPDPIGGIVWLGFDNPAHSARVPLFCGITDLPPSFKIGSQHGYTSDSAAWAFRRASRLAAVNWGATREKVTETIAEFENKAFAELPDIEERAAELFAEAPDKAAAFITTYSCEFAQAMTQKYWELGDFIWDLFAYDFVFTPELLKQFRGESETSPTVTPTFK
ncbi:C69 family dipeptidase [bacterium]|nr:C69 family dipeptidase [bacterium]